MLSLICSMGHIYGYDVSRTSRRTSLSYLLKWENDWNTDKQWWESMSFEMTESLSAINN